MFFSADRARTLKRCRLGADLVAFAVALVAVNLSVQKLFAVRRTSSIQFGYDVATVSVEPAVPSHGVSGAASKSRRQARGVPTGMETSVQGDQGLERGTDARMGETVGMGF